MKGVALSRSLLTFSVHFDSQSLFRLTGDFGPDNLAIIFQYSTKYLFSFLSRLDSHYNKYPKKKADNLNHKSMKVQQQEEIPHILDLIIQFI